MAIQTKLLRLYKFKFADISLYITTLKEEIIQIFFPFFRKQIQHTTKVFNTHTFVHVK